MLLCLMALVFSCEDPCNDDSASSPSYPMLDYCLEFGRKGDPEAPLYMPDTVLPGFHPDSLRVFDLRTGEPPPKSWYGSGFDSVNIRRESAACFELSSQRHEHINQPYIFTCVVQYADGVADTLRFWYKYSVYWDECENGYGVRELDTVTATSTGEIRRVREDYPVYGAPVRFKVLK